MDYYLISDTHFNHEKLEDWGGRSGKWQEKIWEGLNRISPLDILIHLGDICIGNDEEINTRLGNLPCKKILVLGNHDKKSKQWYTEHGWDFVCDAIELVYMGHYLHLTHRPQRPGSRITHNIHGHTHGNMHRSEEYLEFYDTNFHVDISPELVGFYPVKLDTLLKRIKEKNKADLADIIKLDKDLRKK